MKYFAVIALALLICLVRATKDCYKKCPMDQNLVCASNGNCALLYDNQCILDMYFCRGLGNVTQVPVEECYKGKKCKMQFPEVAA